MRFALSLGPQAIEHVAVKFVHGSHLLYFLVVHIIVIHLRRFSLKDTRVVFISDDCIESESALQTGRLPSLAWRREKGCVL